MAITCGDDLSRLLVTRRAYIGTLEVGVARLGSDESSERKNVRLREQVEKVVDLSEDLDVHRRHIFSFTRVSEGLL